MSQSLSQMWVHLIFSTKGRIPVFTDWTLRDRVHKYLAKSCNNLGCPAKIVGGYTDHVHILCAWAKTITLAKLVCEIKSSSSKWIKSLSNDNYQYEKFQWQTGYSAFSVSHSVVERVYNYILKQDLHHQKQNYQDELLKLLLVNNITFDVTYLWDP